MKILNNVCYKFFFFLVLSYSSAGNALPRLLLLSLEPEVLVKTYETLGLKFLTHSFKGKNFFVGHNLPLCIGQSDPTIGARSMIALFQRGSVEKIQADYLPNTSFGLVRLDIEEPLYQLVEKQPALGLSSVFYIPSHATIEEGKDFFLRNEVGPWQLEKHGKGPTHYAYENNGEVFELYPPRTKAPVNIDILFPRSFIIPSFNDEEGRRFRNIP